MEKTNNNNEDIVVLGNNIVFEIENEEELIKKQELKEYREREEFYKTHSKFATYIDSEYLEIFETETISFSKSWIREFGKNMSPERDPGIEGHANTRGLHSLDVALGARDAARRTLLNKDLLRMGGLLHDLGHLAFGHDGEKIIGNYTKNLGVCEVYHPIMSRLMAEEEKIHERTIERLEQKRGRKFTEEELKKYNEYKLIIMDIAAAHNGEGLDCAIKANKDKTAEDMEREFIEGFTVIGAAKKITTKTPEGAIVRFEDPISYVFKDFKDGVISNMIDVNHKEYEEIFITMGIPKETLDKWAKETGKKDKITRYGTYILRDNLEQYSRGIDGARMSENMAKLMYKLRKLNYDKVVKPRTRKIIDVLGDRTSNLIDRYAELLLEYEKTGVKPKELNEFSTGMLRHIKKKQREGEKPVYEIYEKITQEGIENFVRKEVDEVIKGEKNTVTNRRKRLETDIEKLKQDGEITEEIKEIYIQRVLKEINLTPEESQDMLKRRIRLQYPEASEIELEKYINQNKDLRLETYTECFAKTRVVMYIGGSSNQYLCDMLIKEGLLSEQEAATRYLYGGDPANSSITDTEKTQEELAEKAQEELAEEQERE